MLSTPRAAIVAIAAVLAIPLTAALADVNVAIGNADKVAGTLSPADEVETFRVTLPAGAKLTVSTKGKKAKGHATPVVTFRVLGPDGLEAAPFQPTHGTGAKLAGFTATTSGEYSIEVKGDGTNTGDYALSATWSSPRSFGAEGDLGGGSFDLPIDVDADAKGTFSVAAAKGSPAHPWIERVRSEDGTFDVAFDAPAAGAKSQKVKNVVLPAGRLLVTVSDADGSGGAVKAAIAVKPPPSAKRSVVVTDAKIGDAAGERFAFGELLGTQGGLLEVSGTLTGIDGASVSVPPGGLSLPTAIVIGTSSDVPAGAAFGAVGPAVFFGPENLRFPDDKRALLTIPFDPTNVASASAVHVFVRDSKGKVSEVASEPPYPIVDLVNGNVTFPSSHFSSYQVYAGGSTRKAGDLNGDGEADLVVTAPSSAGGLGRVYVFLGGPTLASTSTAAADLTLEGPNSGDEFGRAVLVADLNGDGTDDLAVSSRTPPRVDIWFGSSTFFVAGPPDVTISGEATDPNFGITLAAGKLVGDGSLDLVVGDESNQRVATGAVFVFHGPITADRTASAADSILTAEASGDLFGAALAVGDVIGDGNADLVVGADQQSNGGKGKAYAFAGPLASGTSSALTVTAILVGENLGDGFGLHLAIGDVDGSGRPDVIVGAAGFSSGAGKVYVIKGENALNPIGAVTVTGTNVGDAVGDGLLAVDVFGDARAEIFIGAPGWDQPGTDSGAIGMLAGFSNSNFPTLARIEGDDGAGFGAGGSAPVDLNDDGRLDLVIAAPHDSAGGADAGAVYVFKSLTAGFTGTIDVSSADLVITGQPGEKLGGR